jgi:hypothetical protein
LVIYVGEDSNRADNPEYDYPSGSDSDNGMAFPEEADMDYGSENLNNCSEPDVDEPITK